MAGILAPLTIPGGPRIEMVANPDFHFPMLPPSRTSSGDEVSKRPQSMHINLPPTESSLGSHRRAASTLPSFTFNASNASGRQESTTPPQTPDETTPITPSRRGHRRGGSEFVGGDSRLGVSNALSSSPTKSNALPLPLASMEPPVVAASGRRGHAHRRSAAISSHDLGNIMRPTHVPRLSSSLPNTPLEHPAQSTALETSDSAPDNQDEASDPFGPPLEEVAARPPSRPRVEFSDNVEYIPRPLSTISSETESSLSTVRGLHSHTGSINSVISLGSTSPPSTRAPRVWDSAIADDEIPASKAKSSLEISRTMESEGEWLTGRSSGSLKRPYSESSMAAPRTSFMIPEPTERTRNTHNKKHSLSHALGFDRRRSEPAIGMNASETSRLSAISLQEIACDDQSPLDKEEQCEHEHLLSARRLKQWAKSKVSGRTKEMDKATSANRPPMTRPVSEGGVPISPRMVSGEAAVAETDLNAVFDIPDSAEQWRPAPVQPLLDVNTPTPSQHSSFQSRDLEDVNSPVLDLDAAMGPFKTPPIGPLRPRKELHSSRQLKDFTGPGGHYHRRAESMPDLPPFEMVRIGTPPQHAMADVFEEEEPDDDLVLPPRSASIQSGAEDETGMGVQIVDSDYTMQDAVSGAAMDDAGLGIMREDWEPERPHTAYGNIESRFSSVGSERATSIIEETIVEEASPAEAIEIVEAHEEPRASSLTKSSDSSDTPTIAAPPSGVLTFPNGQSTLMTPATYQTSAFSSPDLGRRQSSFETSRLGTSASSLTDNRTMSSCNTGDHSHDLRVSVDDVPSLTSSRSTMLSTMYANNSRRDVDVTATRTPSASSAAVDPTIAAERRRKRGSIQSLSQLVGGSFGSRSRGTDDARPHTAADPLAAKAPEKKEHRLKKLMFWKSKQHPKQSSQ